MRLDSPSGVASAIVSPADGGRIASLVVDGMELFAPQATEGPLAWGCYATVPWAGRIRDGRFVFRDATYDLPRNLPPHAIHGVGCERPWQVLGDGRLGIDLTEPWPFGGRATQTFAITDDSLRMTLRVEAGTRDMPVALGWHPCLRRQLARGAPGELSFEPGWMWQRDASGIPDGTRVAPPPGPWDDAFGGVTTTPVIRWPRAIELALEADCPVWVVYTERADQICVEPQTGIPNAFNTVGEPTVLSAGESTELTLTVRWSLRR
ncbi:MAG: aldose 1-epimerase [Actinomycetia bacterium]|nr:aldose 1-epimerase [Actinomycetes bacterium]